MKARGSVFSVPTRDTGFEQKSMKQNEAGMLNSLDSLTLLQWEQSSVPQHGIVTSSRWGASSFLCILTFCGEGSGNSKEWPLLPGGILGKVREGHVSSLILLLHELRQE